MELGKRPFAEVVLDLATLPSVSANSRARTASRIAAPMSREQLYEILAIATQFYQHALRQGQS